MIFFLFLGDVDAVKSSPGDDEITEEALACSDEEALVCSDDAHSDEGLFSEIFLSDTTTGDFNDILATPPDNEEDVPVFRLLLL